MYESGKYLTFKKLYEDAIALFKPCPTLTELQDIAFIDRWNKYEHEDIIVEHKKKSCTLIFEELGFTLERRIEELCNIISAPDDIQMQILDTLREMARTEIDPKAKESIQKTLISLFDSRTRASGTKLSAISETFKLTGEHAPTRLDVRSKGNRSPTGGKDPDDMTLEELAAEMKRLQEVGIAPMDLEAEENKMFDADQEKN
jgi:hypothetical protein